MVRAPPTLPIAAFGLFLGLTVGACGDDDVNGSYVFGDADIDGD